MTSPTTPRPPARATGLLMADDAVTLAHVGLDERGRPRLRRWARVALPEGLVVGGLLRHGGRLPAGVAQAVRGHAGGDAVRVVLATPDACCVPLAGGRAQPVEVLEERVRGGEPGDALVADAVAVLGRPVGLAGARRSSVQRTRQGLLGAGVEVAAVEPAPVSLLTAALVALAPLDAPWTLRATVAGTAWAVTVGRGLRLEGGAGLPAPGPPVGLALQAAGRAADAPWVLEERLRQAWAHRGPAVPDADVAAVALAVGAALNGLEGPIDAPDLARAVVVRPFGAPDGLPRWAVEAMPLIEGSEGGGRRRPSGRRAAR